MIATYSTARCYYSQIGNSDELCETDIKATSSLLIDVYHKDDMLAYEIQNDKSQTKIANKSHWRYSCAALFTHFHNFPTPPHRIPVRVPHARLSNNTKF